LEDLLSALFKSFVHDRFGQIDTIVHVGAHLAQELEIYLSLRPKRIIWVEADPEVFMRLESRIIESGAQKFCDIVWINACVSEKDGQVVPFYRFNNDGQSSSLFASTEILREKWRGLEEAGPCINVATRRIESIINSLGAKLGDNSILVLDVQGAELLALRGVGQYLADFKLVEVEVSSEKIYEGGALFQEVGSFMNAGGFKRLTEVPWHGDVVYERLADMEMISITKRQARSINEMSRRMTELLSLTSFGGSRRSQLGQDIFVLSELCFKRQGFFVEFGATNGVDLSNTFMLEKCFDWRGVLAEPAKKWLDALRKNRSADIETACVWHTSGETLVFNETEEAELSTLDQFSSSDLHAAARTDGNRYEVTTISLMDMLRKHDAPMEIDYLSIDTEGSELTILESFDFSIYSIKIITCEHNYTGNREKIFELLSSKGYVRKFEGLSQFDDWYVKA